MNLNETTKSFTTRRENISKISKSLLQNLENALKSEPDKEYKSRYDFFLSTYGNIISINKLIFIEKKYQTGKGIKVDLMQYLDKMILKHAIQFPIFPIISQEIQFKNGNYIDTILELYNERLKFNLKKERKLFSCFLDLCIKNKKKVVDENSRIQLLDFSKEIKNEPMLINNNEKHVLNKQLAMSVKISKGEDTLNLNNNNQIIQIKKEYKTPEKLFKDKFFCHSQNATPKNVDGRFLNIGGIKDKDTLLFEKCELPFTFNSKQIDFFLSNDVLKCILFCQKNSSSKFIVHNFTFCNNKFAINKDVFMSDMYIRSNLEALLKNINFKMPLALNGNLFLPSVTFYRSNFQKEFKLLENPISCPILITQMIYETILDGSFEEIDLINYEFIKDNLNISEVLNFETIVVNFTNIDNHNYIQQIIKFYLDLCDEYQTVNNLIFLINYEYDSFEKFITLHTLNETLEKKKIKTRIFNE